MRNLLQHLAIWLSLISGTGAAFAQNSKGQIESDSFWSNASKGFTWIDSARTIPPAPSTSPLEISPTALQPDISADLDRSFDPGIHRIFILTRNRQIIHSKYNDRWVDRKSTPISFSMAKSLTSLAVGKALCGGHIKSLDDRAEVYSRRLSGTSWGNAKIRDLLRMASGSHPPGSTRTGSPTPEVHAETLGVAYQRGIKADLLDLMRRSDGRYSTSGLNWYYNNLDTQALAFVVEDAVGRKFIDFFASEIWHPAGAQGGARWFHTAHGQIVGFTGFTAHPHDWIRIGFYVLDELERGECFGRYLKEAISRPPEIRYPNSEIRYGYQMWIDCGNTGAFCFIGHGGQVLLMHPESKMVLYLHSTSLTGNQPLYNVFRKAVSAHLSAAREAKQPTASAARSTQDPGREIGARPVHWAGFLRCSETVGGDRPAHVQSIRVTSFGDTGHGDVSSGDTAENVKVGLQPEGIASVRLIGHRKADPSRG